MKNIVVSGASKGIGRAIVLYFAQKGFNVAFCSRSEENLLKLKEEVLAINHEAIVLAIKADVSKIKELHFFAEIVKANFDKIDVLVNNAGVFLQGNLTDMEFDDFDTVLKTNLYSAFILTQEFTPFFKNQNNGYIFNISSIAGLEAYKNGGAYNVSKHALTGFSKTLRNELKDFNIKVSTVYPGATLTDSWAGVDLPENRFIPAEDIAKTIFNIYSLSDRTVVEDIILRPQLGDI
ncbi:MAG: SDR family oxidoreductase [Chitinophagales bacterium]|nr:SDR family oxidoreductase [Bacteroidota bacterium]MCB9227219.1 SDR family oxidoreductase [Chitinophagales bacterium]